MIVETCARCFGPRPCAKHPKQTDWKTGEERKFYSSRRWTATSLRHRRHEPLCRTCKANGITKRGQMTDHIIAIRNGGSPFDESNLQTMCKSCHDAKRNSERRGGR